MCRQPSKWVGVEASFLIRVIREFLRGGCELGSIWGGGGGLYLGDPLGEAVGTSRKPPEAKGLPFLMQPAGSSWWGLSPWCWSPVFELPRVCPQNASIPMLPSSAWCPCPQFQLLALRTRYQVHISSPNFSPELLIYISNDLSNISSWVTQVTSN